MKRILLASVAALGLAGTASAADLAVKAPPLVPVFTWSGCYLGANAGWIGGNDAYTLQPAGLWASRFRSRRLQRNDVYHSYKQNDFERHCGRPVWLPVAMGRLGSRRRVGLQLERPEGKQWLYISRPRWIWTGLIPARIHPQAARLVLDGARAPRLGDLGPCPRLWNGRPGRRRCRLLYDVNSGGQLLGTGLPLTITSAPIARSALAGPLAAASSGPSPTIGPSRPSSCISTSARSTTSRRTYSCGNACADRRAATGTPTSRRRNMWRALV